jgi:protein TonB
MPDDHNLVPQAGSEGPLSTTDEVLRLLGEQAAPSDGDDELENPELEQLLGSLSKGLEEGLPDSVLGVPSGPLTLEDLVLGVPSAPPAPESGVCADCGRRNPPSTRFCGMCGHELGMSSPTGKVSGNGSEPAAARKAVPEALAAPPEAAAPARAGQGWKIAFLALLCCLTTGLVIYQQQLWRLPLPKNSISPAAPAAIPKAPPVSASVVAEQAPAPASSGPSLPSVQPAAKPSKTASPSLAPPAGQSPSKAAPTVEAAAPLSPSAANRDAPERTPAISVPAAPIDLPTLIKPPSSSPVLEGAGAAASAHESSLPKISQGVVSGAVIYKVNPQYPLAARSARVQGSVVMHAVVGTDGTVQQLRVISGNPLLVNAAMEAVKKWRYSPFLLGGKPVEGETTITVNFKGE